MFLCFRIRISAKKEYMLHIASVLFLKVNVSLFPYNTILFFLLLKLTSSGLKVHEDRSKSSDLVSHYAQLNHEVLYFVLA